MILKDNTKYSSNIENIEEFLSLQNIANRNISELLDEYGNSLLVFPYSFAECEDKMGGQPIFVLQTTWSGPKCTKAHLQTGNLVGFIGINGKSISIHSRFSQKSDEDYFLHYMLQKVLHINIVNLPHGTNNESIFNFLIYLFPKLLNEALSQGIYKEYQRNEYNNMNMRGVIDINRHIKKNMPFNGCIAYRTREFSYDNHVTELIRHTIEYIGTTTFGMTLLDSYDEIRFCVKQVVAATPNYKRQEREKVIKNNLNITSHPYYTHYAPLQKLCLRILRHEKIKYRTEDNKIHGILFDVSYLWEEYLATILTKQGFEHPNNRKDIGRIYLAKANKFPRYLDFFREYDKTIVDAKYKIETEKREDVHQMLTYMYRLKGKYGIFIYPTLHEHSRKCYYLRGYGEDCCAELQTYMFHIPRNANDYKEFIWKISIAENLLQKHINIPGLFHL